MNRVVNAVSGRLSLRAPQRESLEALAKAIEQSDERLLDPKRDISALTAGAKWCKNASQHLLANGGKEWKYLLIPHDEVKEHNVMENFVQRFTHK